MKMTYRLFGLVGLAALLAGCTSGPPDQGLALSPQSPSVRVGEQVALTAEPLEDLSKEPEWEIQETDGGGFLNSRGFHVTYVAPVSAGRYHLVLRTERPDGSRIKVVQEIQVLPLPQIQPDQTSVPLGGIVAFSVRMKGLPKNTATWSVDEPSGGTVDENGLYQAPMQAGTYHVKAVSTLDTEASALATVVVQ
jgi:hypothetical protein